VLYIIRSIGQSSPLATSFFVDQISIRPRFNPLLP
jgi:hypothetical protein